MSDRSRREEGGRGYEQEQAHKHASPHTSVLLREVLEYLAPKDGEVVVDATFGAGGHSRALRAAAHIKLIALDADSTAAQEEGVIEANFGDLKKVLHQAHASEVHKVLFDLGWRSEQLSAGKGFSFQVDEPLTMSYGAVPASGFTAAQILNTWDEETLANIFYGYGEERYARRIARAVVTRRRVQPIESTLELAELVRDSVPPAYRHGRINPATRTFQALRIAVNDELSVLERGLAAAWEHLACGGRIAVITFHSIEDRKVKQLFASYAKVGGTLVTKKPLTAGKAELATNPRARSAKLRVIEKTC